MSLDRIQEAYHHRTDYAHGAGFDRDAATRDLSGMTTLSRFSDPAAMEFTAADMLAMGQSVVARAVEHIAALPQQPAIGDVDAADLCRALRESAPEDGSELEPLLDQLFDDVIPRSFTPPSPGYLA